MATVSPSKTSVKEGENLELSCTTSGVPAPELIWKMLLASNYEVSSSKHNHAFGHVPKPKRPDQINAKNNHENDLHYIGFKLPLLL